MVDVLSVFTHKSVSILEELDLFISFILNSGDVGGFEFKYSVQLNAEEQRLVHDVSFLK